MAEKTGFETTGYIDKKGTPSGESAAHWNQLPPGQDISKQDLADIRAMPMKELVSTSYPGDGWQG